MNKRDAFALVLENQASVEDAGNRSRALVLVFYKYIYCNYNFSKLQTKYKKRVVVQNKSNLLMKFILYNTWTFQ
jgi:hypothetical protein